MRFFHSAATPSRDARKMTYNRSDRPGTLAAQKDGLAMPQQETAAGFECPVGLPSSAYFVAAPTKLRKENFDSFVPKPLAAVLAVV